MQSILIHPTDNTRLDKKQHTNWDLDDGIDVHPKQNKFVIH